MKAAAAPFFVTTLWTANEVHFLPLPPRLTLQAISALVMDRSISRLKTGSIITW
jgi:hypothetical protein